MSDDRGGAEGLHALNVVFGGCLFGRRLVGWELVGRRRLGLDVSLLRQRGVNVDLGFGLGVGFGHGVGVGFGLGLGLGLDVIVDFSRGLLGEHVLGQTELRHVLEVAG